MPEAQQVKRLILSQFQQFRLCDFDFTSPETGRPLGRICLTGPNGTGKSTILGQLFHAIDPAILPIAVDEEREANALILIQYTLGSQTVYLARNGPAFGSRESKFDWFSDDIENAPGWDTFLSSGMGFREFVDQFETYRVNEDESIAAPDTVAAWMSPTMDLVDSRPADDLRELVDSLTAAREALFTGFLKQPDNREKTVALVEEEFARTHPDPLAEIAAAWKDVLAPAQIRFSGAVPAGLFSARTGESIPFTSLSPGIQKFLLRTAHLSVLRSQPSARRHFLAIDEPENGLSAAVTGTLLAHLLQDEPGESQTVIATLSDDVVARFTGEEIFHLNFDPENGITVTRAIGKTAETEAKPAGKRTRPGAVAIARLKREIKETEDQDELADLIDELMSMRAR